MRVRLPNRSHLLRVAEFRYVQSKYEPAELSNPDFLAGSMLSWFQRAACDLYSALGLRRLRARPFYYYLVARTRYYDQLLLDAVNGRGASFVLIIGCGGDTRPYRFAKVLRDRAVEVLECDQPDAIRAKRRIVSQHWPTEHVDFLDINLNDTSWPELGRWLSDRRSGAGLVILEGVSPYIDDRPFGAFLEFLAASLHSDSTVGYDFKIAGLHDQWGRERGSSTPGFRLPADLSKVTEYHAARGFSVDFFELSSALTREWLPGLESRFGPPFEEDGLLQITPSR